jgi:uncharacterized protein (TIGR02453 family)
MMAGVASTTSTRTFSGFRPQLLEFLAGLRANNTRDWFQAHRQAYDELLMEPSRAFVVRLGEVLKQNLGEDIHAEPKVHGSILAITRDTRFSADKTPYKSHLDLWFWQGDGPGRERPGYFFRLTPESLILGAGMHAFPEQALESYRRAVLDDSRGTALEAAAERCGTEIGGRTYKRVPAGLPAEHPRADWLRHSGLFAEVSLEPVPQDAFSEAFPEWCLAQYTRVAPLQRWLVELLAA